MEIRYIIGFLKLNHHILTALSNFKAFHARFKLSKIRIPIFTLKKMYHSLEIMNSC